MPFNHKIMHSLSICFHSVGRALKCLQCLKFFFHPIAQNCDYMEQMLFLFFCTSDNLIEMVILYFKLQFLPLTDN